MRADILRGDLRPEMRLKLRELAARYGVSVAPIRESLQQLQGEGLVVMQPHRGASVRRIDDAMLINVFDVREAIESFLTMKFAVSVSPHQLAQLEALQSEHDAHVLAGDFASAQSVNARFHRLINAAARNQEALDILDRHLAMTRSFRIECGFNPIRMRATQTRTSRAAGGITRARRRSGAQDRRLAHPFIARRPAWAAAPIHSSDKHTGRKHNMTNGQTGIGRRAVLGGVAAAGTATYLQRAWAADPLKQVPRNRTYIVASSNDGPMFTNFQNANYYSTAVDLRNGLMYAYEPLFLYDFFRDEHIPWLARKLCLQ